MADTHHPAAIADIGDLTLLCEMIAEENCPYCHQQSITLITPTPILSIHIQCGWCGWELKEPRPIELGDLKLISQAMLVELHQLSVLERRRKALRLQIIAAIEAGVSIAPGPLTARVTQHSAQSTTWSNVAEHLGEEAVEILRARILPKPHTALQVVPSHDHLLQAYNLRPQDFFGLPTDHIQ